MSWRRIGRILRFCVLWPGLFVYFRGSHRSRVIVRCNDDILLIRDSTTFFFDELHWTLPGGGIHRRETPAFGAARELAEEIGIQLSASDLQAIGTETSGNYGLRYQAHFFVADVAVLPTITLDSREVAAAEWFSMSDIPALPLKREVRQGLARLATHQ